MTRLSHTLLCCWILVAAATAPFARPALAGEREVEPSATETARPLPPRSTARSATGGTSDRHWIDIPRGAWRTIGSLALIVGLIFGLRIAITRFGGPLAKARAPSGIIEVLGRFPLSRGQTLLLIKIDRRVLLLSQAGGSLTTLSEITDAEQVASLLQRLRHEQGDSFTRRFEQLITPVRDRSDAALTSSDESPVVVDLTRKSHKTPAQRIAGLFADGGRR